MTKLHCPTCGVEIDEHEATTCLDAWVAERVMGWEKCNNWWMRPVDGEICRLVTAAHSGSWNPSQDIAAAWVLVEKVADLHGCQFSIERVGRPWEIKCGRYGAVVSGGDLWYERPDLTLAVYAPTAPLAITRAAIKAASG